MKRLLVGKWARLACCTWLLVSLCVAQEPASLADETHHRFIFENQYFRIYELHLPPQSVTSSYRCEHDSLLIAFENSMVKDMAEPLELSKGEPRLFQAGTTHRLANETAIRLQALMVEVLVTVPPKPDRPCKCPPESPGSVGVTCGCGGGVTGIGVGDGDGSYVHSQGIGRAIIDTFGLRPVATFSPRNRPVPDYQITPGKYGKLLLAIDDLNFRLGASDRSGWSVLSKGDVTWIDQPAWVEFPQPAQCSWDNFLVDGKISKACAPSIFVTLEPRLPESMPVD